MESVAKQDGEFNLFLKHTVLKNKYNFVSFLKINLHGQVIFIQACKFCCNTVGIFTMEVAGMCRMARPSLPACLPAALFTCMNVIIRKFHTE